MMADREQPGGTETRGDFSGQVVARLLNITERRLQQLAREGVIPKSSRGKYPLAGTIRAYIKYLQESGGGGNNSDPEQMEPFKRRAYYQAAHEKLQLELKSGDLLARAEVETELARVFDVMARFLDVLTDNMEREGVVNAAGAIRVEEFVNRARVDLYKQLREQPDDDAATGSA